MVKNIPFADRYCRTCLQELNDNEVVEESLKKHPILSEIADKLVSCTAVTVQPNDEYPQNLCDCCYKELNKFDAFRIMCIESKYRFRDMLQVATLGVEEMKDKKELSMTEQSIIEDETKQFLNSKSFFEAEIHEVETQEVNLIENPLEIDSKKLRNRGRSHTISRSIKSTQVSSKIVQCETISCNRRLNSETKEIPRNEDGCSLRYIGRRSRRIKPHNKKHPQQQQTDENPCKSSKVFQCKLCSMRFFVEHRFTAHKRTHDGLIPYPCPHENCKRGFERWHSLSEHLKQHEGTNRWFTCKEQDCNRRYKHKATLDLHLRRYHKKGPELKSFVCEICGKVFKSSAILNDHRFTHKEKSELPFACHQPQCKHRFSNKAKLKIHMMRHAGIKKYVCPHCGMRKTTRNELNIHINYHTLERRFPCRFCPQVCNNAGNLKVHVRTVHERAKDYACRFCERTFAKPDTRKYHEMIHTGEKPHECSECGKRFVQPAALRTHKKIHLRQHTQCAALLTVETTHNQKAEIGT